MDIETLNGKKVDCADVSKVSLRDMYLRICECRDFEIAHVWHRAIFLTAFLLGCFTAYGTVALRMFHESQFEYSWFLNLISFAIAIVGIVMSLFWIMMAKGSKAWYELYEKAICAFSTVYKTEGCDPKAEELSKHDWRELIASANMSENIRSGCIFSVVGGAFSVSKINIGIGILAYCVWVGIAFVHILIASKYMTISTQEWIASFLSLCKSASLCPFTMLVALLIACVGLPFWFSYKFKSGYLSKRS